MPAPDHWISTGSRGALTHVFDGIGSSRGLLASLADCVVSSQLPTIAKHWSGGGAELGLNFQVVRTYWIQLLRKERYSDAGRLLCIATGACWPNARKTDFADGALDQYNGICQRCLSSVETDLHRFWQCPHNSNSTDPAIVESQNLCKYAIKESPAKDVFWMCGIPLASMFEVPEPEPSYDISQLGRLEDLQQPPGKPWEIFSDGSLALLPAVPIVVLFILVE